jgi:tight adherence protein C
MVWLISVAVFATFFLVTYGVLVLWDRRQRVKVRVGNPGPGGSASPLLRSLTGQPSTAREWVGHVLTLSGQWALPDLEKVTEMRRDLIKAGYRHPRAPAMYMGLRILAAFAFSFPFMIHTIIRGGLNPLSFVVAFALAIFGFFLVSKVLAVKIKHRQENLDRSLPDIIDLFVISMEAGLSLNAALQRVAEEIRGVYRDFSDELQIAAGELRAGVSWDEAFDNLSKRTDVQSIRSMVGLMIQSNKLGASIGDALRNHSDFIRTQRILLAEEKAAKLTIKMVFPLLFCIMPSIVIVAAGPGIIQIAAKLPQFFNMGGGGFGPR